MRGGHGCLLCMDGQGDVGAAPKRAVFVFRLPLGVMQRIRQPENGKGGILTGLRGFFRLLFVGVGIYLLDEAA